MKFTPGPGMGGHCIPVDPFYLAWVARRAGAATRFVELAGELNRRMPEHVVERTVAALAARGAAIDGARVLVLGLAYKPDVDATHESPAIRILELLAERGARLSYSDPWIPAAPPECARLLERPSSVELSPESITSFDAVLVVTDHTAFDWDLVAAHAPLVVDTRDALGARMKGRAGYFRA